jgi:hypothetical protein
MAATSGKGGGPRTKIAAWTMENLAALDVDRHPQTPAAVAAEEDFRACTLLGARLS